MWAKPHPPRGIWRHAPWENFEFYNDSGAIWVCNTMQFSIIYFGTRKQFIRADLTQELDCGWSSSSWPVIIMTSTCACTAGACTVIYPWLLKFKGQLCSTHPLG